MSAVSALLPPAVPRTSPANNVMAFQMERRASASTAIDAVREAAAGDPRSALRQAHQERAAATAEAARLTDVLARAREHLSGIEERRSAAEAVARHTAAAAATGLIAALGAGEDITAATIDDGEAALVARLGRQVDIASAAVDRLASELADAQERERVATWRVRALALARLEAHGVAIAEAMLKEQQEMRRRRAHLASLDVLLATEARAIYGDAVAPPTVIAAATAAIDPPPAWKPTSSYVPRPAEAPNPWSGYFLALLDDAEAELG